MKNERKWGKEYQDRIFSKDQLAHVAFPMGGLGAGMICLEGTGAFSHVSLRHKPDIFNEPLMFAALYLAGSETARVLEGPAPMRKIFGVTHGGGGLGGTSYGLPRFSDCSFSARFPFGKVTLQDKKMPFRMQLTGWSPFIPGNPDDSSLPVAAVEYNFYNHTSRTVKGVFSFHAANFIKADLTTSANSRMKSGFVLAQPATKHWQTPFISQWRVSKRMKKTTSIDKAPVVQFSDSLEWSFYPADANGFLNLHRHFGDGDGLVYAGAKIRVPVSGTWLFQLGHDGGIRLFADKKPLFADPVLRNPAYPDRNEIPVRLDAGEHEIIVAFDLSKGSGWGLWLRFAMPLECRNEINPVLPESDFISQEICEGYFAAFTRGHPAKVDCAWFRGGWLDPLTMVWQNIFTGKALDKKPHSTGGPGNGASLYVPFKLAPKAEITIPLLMAWYVPHTDLTVGRVDCKSAECNCGQKADNYYTPWYAKRFKGIVEVCEYWNKRYDSLRDATAAFSRCFYDTTLPSEAVEAVAANLTILKSPTCLRQADGRLWGWEGCCDKDGCCHGSCTHVWNYAQAIPHLFPTLERSLRETEYQISQDERGHQNFRSALPIGPTGHDFHAAADGQLGGIIKAYREWRISGDTDWMKSLWPRIRASLEYCIKTWDPDHTGTLLEPHHNTYDIEFWGADAMCTGFYLGALKAAAAMGKTCGADIGLYETLLGRGKEAMESRLWNGNYFIQKIQWRNLHATSKDKTLFQNYSPEAMALLAKEGPMYQYGKGCLSDGVLGDWLARVCGLEPVLDEKKAASHVDAVFRHNFRATLVDHANPQRPGFALGNEAGLLLCSWPKGDKLSLPFIYSNEVWTGFEYQVAAHLIMFGRVQKGLDIVRAARKRYDGRWRNPFNEYECGHWYARAMSSYSLLQAFSGARYDAVEKTLYLKPAIKGDFRAFLSTAGGYGTVGIKKGRPFLKVISGKIDVQRIIMPQLREAQISVARHCVARSPHTVRRYNKEYPDG